MFATLLILAMLVAPAAEAQSFDLTIQDYGLSVGDSRKVNGLRLNFRDRQMKRVNGINLTLWDPIQPVHGVVRGLALGLRRPVQAVSTASASGSSALARRNQYAAS